MRLLAILVGAIALTVPVVASANGGQHGGEREGKRATAGLFASVAVEVCRERQVRPFGFSEEGEKAARQGNRRCAKRVLKHERLLARAVLVCTEQLAEEETLSRRALTDCLVGLLARKFGGRDERNDDEAKPKVPDEKKDTVKKDDPPSSDAAAVAACKDEFRDEGFAEEHGGLSFVEYYGEDDGADEDEAFGRCVTSKLSDD